MSKQKLFVDCDLTICDTITAFCNAYNILYKDHPEFKPADPNKIKKYNFKYLCPLIGDPSEIFGHWLLFENLNLMPNAYDVLKELNETYQLIVCSIGIPRNISLKVFWLEQQLPFIKDYVMITNQGCKMDKSVVQMQKSIFIDDIIENLESSNAERKILFGKIYEWNKGWKGEYCLGWENVREKLI